MPRPLEERNALLMLWTLRRAPWTSPEADYASAMTWNASSRKGCGSIFRALDSASELVRAAPGVSPALACVLAVELNSSIRGFPVYHRAVMVNRMRFSGGLSLAAS